MFRKTTLPLHAAPSEAYGSASSKGRNLTLDDIQSDSIAKITNKAYGGKTIKWDAKVVETIVDQELVPSNYEPKKLMLLEFTQYLEKYLWPYFDGEKSTLNHVVSICLMVNEKFRQRVAPFDAFRSDTAKFSAFFARVIRLAVGEEAEQLPLMVKRFIILFLIHCFQSLANPMVRTECQKLVSIAIWHNFGQAARREDILSEYVPLRKLWNSSNKKFAAADDDTKGKLIFERNWLSALLREFIGVVYQIPESGDAEEELIRYCERLVELIIDLETQLPTRRFFNTLLDDHQIVVLCRLAPLMKREDKDVDLLKQLLETLGFYAKFEINDQTGLALTDLDMTEARNAQLIKLQTTTFRQFRDTFPELPLANLGSIEQREDLLWHFGPASADDLARLCEAVHIRSSPIVESVLNVIEQKQLLLESLIAKYEKRTSQIEKINALPLYPDENTLFNDSLVQTQFYTGDRPLSLPKLNLQFLTIHDYLLRNFTLFRLESSYEIRQDMEDVVKRLSPRLTYPDRVTEFAGWARMAVPIESFQIVDVARPHLGEDKPAHVHADVSFNVGRYTETLRREWDSMRKHDVLFLLTIQANDDTSQRYTDDKDFKKHFGIKYIRGCEIVDVLGSDGRAIDEVSKPTVDDRAKRWTNSMRTFRVELDANQYKMDMTNFNKKNKEDVYPTFNILVRRKPQENNFKAVLETIRDLMQSDLVVPDWLQKVFLGYGDPASAHYTHMPNRVRHLNFRDTFLDYDHIVQSFPDKKVQPAPDAQTPLEPPFIIDFLENEAAEEKPKKKSKKAAAEKQAASPETLQVSSYTLPNQGPYPQDVPKRNAVRFTPVQAESIHSGMNHGLTMVVGPPGTGKTDVAVQTIANLYHNYPNQHTLVVTHSNQALNQIFEKMMALDIDPRHLVRLGHGEEELNSEVSFSKYGRVESFLQRRLELLQEVTRLAYTLNVPGDHGASCETADYFFRYQVVPLWESFLQQAESGSLEDIRNKFPFVYFFANAPKPVFAEDATTEEALEAARGCFRHLEKLFTELEEIRAFELLRSGTDRANYLITKEAKIIAMTCTHAALKRRELVGLNFKYDNIVMEEAAQILEVETFIPLLLQEPQDGESRLKRVMLIGDHHQLPPVVKNMAFQQYGNMEQSMFTRFVRLGVPAMQLDLQGRARSSIAKLYSWRYDHLGDLPMIQGNDEYVKANPGFTYDYQLINVDKYQGEGETEPVPYFYQNLGEAEYIVAVYQYMRLLGYPAEKISILTTYNGQKALIKDVLQRRCSWNPYFGMPADVTTVDQYQGQQNDYILLSLVRTKSVGHIRDVRRLIVAVSRARLGLYMFCRKELFEKCYELKPVFDQFLQRPVQLSLQHDENYPPSARKVDDLGEATTMDDVEEMGNLVYKLSQEQLEAFRSEENQDNAEEPETSTMETDA